MVTGTGNFDMCELLAVNGADVNLVDNEGNTPLYIAAVEGHPTIQQLLLR
jgi:ankyrin repeat protein